MSLFLEVARRYRNVRALQQTYSTNSYNIMNGFISMFDFHFGVRFGSPSTLDFSRGCYFVHVLQYEASNAIACSFV